MLKHRWSDQLLDQMREKGDPLADKTVHILFSDGEIEHVNRLLVNLIENDQLPPEDLPPVVREYFEKSALLPSWADPKLIERGEHFFMGYGMMALPLLACSSLPEAYSIGDGVQVLALTQRLERHVYRRITETTQMVIDVMSPGGLEPNGRGILTAQKVRLMHAAIRHLILHERSNGAAETPSGNFAGTLVNFTWKEEWGLPINQEYMAGTLMTFSYVILKGIRDFAVELQPEDEEAYFHCWNVVGHILGVKEELLVWTMDEAKGLYDRIAQRGRRQTPEGIELTKSLVRYMEKRIRNTTSLGGVLPLRYFPKIASHIPKMLIRESVGKETADMLRVKLDPLDTVCLVPFRMTMWWLAKVNQEIYGGRPFARRAAEWVFRKLVEEMLRMPRGSNRQEFNIPDQLTEAWRVKAN